jgi:hypothetical protein
MQIHSKHVLIIAAGRHPPLSKSVVTRCRSSHSSYLSYSARIEDYPFAQVFSAGIKTAPSTLLDSLFLKRRISLSVFPLNSQFLRHFAYYTFVSFPEQLLFINFFKKFFILHIIYFIF